MVSTFAPVFSAILALASLAGAQTSTSCNPLDTTCPSDQGLTDKSFSTDFTSGQSSSWTAACCTPITYSSMGAGFTVNAKTDAPTIETNFYMLFGYIEVKMRAAPGTGIVSSIVLQSDDLDEVDWEFLGGNDAAVQTNFFGKGNTTTYDRMVQVPVTATTSGFHTYALNWTSSSLTWLIDGTPVRTLMYTDALALGGQNYPQTPSKLKLGIWAGGASSSPGTVEWAGGATNFAQAPFTAYVQSVKITNYNPTSAYTYSDKSGSYQSIKMDAGSVSSGSTSSSNSIAGVNSTSLANSGNGGTNATTTSTTSAPSGSGASSYSSATTLSASVSAAASSSSAPVASFTPGPNSAGRQAEATGFGIKVAYSVMAVVGLFVAQL